MRFAHEKQYTVNFCRSMLENKASYQYILNSHSPLRRWVYFFALKTLFCSCFNVNMHWLDGHIWPLCHVFKNSCEVKRNSAFKNMLQDLFKRKDVCSVWTGSIYSNSGFSSNLKLITKLLGFVQAIFQRITPTIFSSTWATLCASNFLYIVQE